MLTHSCRLHTLLLSVDNTFIYEGPSVDLTHYGWSIMVALG